MNIDVIEKLIKSKSHYFIGSLEPIIRNDYGNYKDLPNIFLFSVPSEILKMRPEGKLNEKNNFVIEDSQISLELMKKINECYINTNIPLSNNHTPFQLGIAVSRFDEIYELTDGKINEFLLKVFTLRSQAHNQYLNYYQYLNYSIYDYKKLYNEITQ